MSQSIDMPDTVVATAAHDHDVMQAHAFLHGDETDVFANVVYVGVAKRAENQGCTMNWHVFMRPVKRRALSGTSLDKVLETIEHTKARIRAKVEHSFHVEKNFFKHKKARNRGMPQNAAQLQTLFGLTYLMLAKRRSWLLPGLRRSAAPRAPFRGFKQQLSDGVISAISLTRMLQTKHFMVSSA